MNHKGLRRVLALVMLLAALTVYLRFAFSGSGLSTDDQRFLRVSDRQVLPFSEVIAEIKAVPLVFVGELHDEPAHHWAQLQVIRALKESGRKVAVGMEMFRHDQQNHLDLWSSGEMTLHRFRDIYLESWGAPWPLYADIFHYARSEGIPLLGLNVPREIVTQVARRGFDSLSEDQLKRLPPLSCDVDDVYQEFIRRALGVTHKSGLDFQHFCEAQLVWDTAMAWNLMQYLERNPGYTVVVLAGSGHSWKRAIPEQVRRRSDLAYRVILPEMPSLERDVVLGNDTDFLWLDLPLRNAS
ncbi:MAG: ChaN family lipoprotein [bacterium]|nr:ChaN family lipoprotein [bacterium]